ncbi:MAG: hypothetical protein BMS9Abin29_1903 [Gemmatimonadota bacterium]|nr:MAG: hypothetical protein BMS9Abin29_1903 [Gemmatimonadota bacterium]
MTDAITRLNAALEGRYAIEHELGAGGMATVYLADDLKHERKVALKVLKPELAAIVGAERFLAEIKVTANLNHPHILPLHDSGEANSFLFYVMPHVEGESLRDRLDREKQLPIDEAVRIATAVANALDHAHRHKVIHRDIKPANILLQDGEPVVADFGIALAVGAAGSSRLTETGLSLGTPHYMSPEQATGDQPVGASTDTYALGSVLYEMLVGEPPYPGTTAQAVLGKIIAGKPVSATEQRPSIPANIDASLRCALEKLPADRFTSAQDFARALGDEHFRYGDLVLAGAGANTWNRLSVTTTITTVMFALLAGWGWFGRPPPPVPPIPIHAEITGLVPNAMLAAWERLAISPDGRWIVAYGADGTNNLSIRRADETDWRQLPETEGGFNPVFSPDGRSVAIGGGGNALWTVPLAGGPRQLIVEHVEFFDWLGSDTLVFSWKGLYKVGAWGGEPELLAPEDAVSSGFGRLHMLPDGRSVLFNTRPNGNPTNARILLLEIETGDLRELIPSGVSPQYVSTGHLIYAHGEQRLMAVRFDPDAREIIGSPVMVVPELTVRPGGASQYAISATGTLVYSRAAVRGVSDSRVLVQVEMDGTATRLPPRPGGFSEVQYSPNGRQLAITYEGEIHLYDVLTGAMRQFTHGGGSFPKWSPDGVHLYFSSERGSALDADAFRKRADGSAMAELLYGGPGTDLITDVLPGDSVLLVQQGRFNSDLLLMRFATDGVEFEPFLTAAWNERLGTVSPDGDQVAYVSDESGSDEVYVRSFPDAGNPLRVSSGGGDKPLWAPDGLAIYYLNGSRIMRTALATGGGFSPPEFLFDRPNLVFGGRAGARQRRWDLDPSGSHFLTVEVAADQEAVAPPRSGNIFIVVNFFEELKERVGN